MACVAAVVIFLWVAALIIPMLNSLLYGDASGAPVMMLVYIVLVAAERRGYETFVVREPEKREDERDKAVLQRAWTFTSIVGLIDSAVIGTVGAFGGPMTPVLAIIL